MQTRVTLTLVTMSPNRYK